MYNHQQNEYWLTLAAGASLVTVIDPVTAGVIPIRPGYQPFNVSTIYAVIVTAPTVTASTVVFKYRPVLGSATGEVIIGTLNFPVATAIGRFVYKRVDNVKCSAAGEIVLQVTVGSTAGAAAFGFMANPTWEAPGNNAIMLAST